jgi:glucan biosynthesis protein
VRTASFGVENLFERAKALAEEDWNKRKPALEAQGIAPTRPRSLSWPHEG